MKRKDNTVQCKFHPMLNAFLWVIDDQYKRWKDELVITSGSEPYTRHGYTSFHYADPCCGADIRMWDRTQGRGRVPSPEQQVIVLEDIKDDFCVEHNMPDDWIEIILEGNHIHIEYQPKRCNQ